MDKQRFDKLRGKLANWKDSPKKKNSECRTRSIKESLINMEDRVRKPNTHVTEIFEGYQIRE